MTAPDEIKTIQAYLQAKQALKSALLPNPVKPVLCMHPREGQKTTCLGQALAEYRSICKEKTTLVCQILAS